MLPRQKIHELYRRLSETIVPKSDLEFDSVFHLLVAVALSAQTTDRAVNRATKEFFPSHPTPQSFLDWGLAPLEEAIHSLGFYHSKARHVLGLCQKLVDDFGGEVPGTLQELTSLPGVGVKTAKVVLSIGFRQQVIAVDTHIFRVAHRLGLSSANTPEQVSTDLEKHTPKKYLPDAHHYLLLHGRYTCTAKNPRCNQCALANGGLCEYHDRMPKEK